MTKKIKLEVTKTQLSAICEIADTLSAMVGCGENDDEWNKLVTTIDRMLKANGYKRLHK